MWKFAIMKLKTHFKNRFSQKQDINILNYFFLHADFAINSFFAIHTYCYHLLYKEKETRKYDKRLKVIFLLISINVLDTRVFMNINFSPISWNRRFKFTSIGGFENFIIIYSYVAINVVNVRIICIFFFNIITIIQWI